MTLPTTTSSPQIEIGILEDQRVLRESLGHLLEASGFKVRVSCASMEELNSALPTGRPDVLLVDLRPEGPQSDSEGWAMLEHLGRWHPHVRVVVMSSSRDPKDVERAQRARASGYLPTDTLSSEELMAALRRVHAGETVFPVLSAFTAAVLETPSRAALPSALQALTAREVDTLRYVAAGHDNQTIATCLEISERTVRAHVSALYRKLGSENRAQLALLARELGVRPPK